MAFLALNTKVTPQIDSEGINRNRDMPVKGSLLCSKLWWWQYRLLLVEMALERYGRRSLEMEIYFSAFRCLQVHKIVHPTSIREERVRFNRHISSGFL